MVGKFGMLSLLVFVLGCSKSEQTVQEIGSGFWTGASITDVVFSVDRQVYRIADFEDDVRLNAYLIRAKFGEGKLAPDFMKKLRDRRLSCFVREEMPKCLALSYVEQKGLAVDEAAELGVRLRMAQSFARPGENFEQIRDRIAQVGLVEPFDRMVERESRLLALFSTKTFPEMNITEADVDRYIEYSKNLAKAGKEANAKAQKLAGELCQRIRAGEDFGKLADQYSQDPDKKPGAGGRAVELDGDDFKMMQMEDVWKRLWELKDGEILGPINTEATGGWMIYKVVRHIEKGSLTGQPALMVGKILLREVMDIPIADRDEARRNVYKTRGKKIEDSVFNDMKKSAVISFPHGIDFLPSESRQYLKKEFPNLFSDEK